MQTLQATLSLVGRILLAAIFVISGIGKVIAAEGTQQHMGAAGLPLVPVLYVLTVIVEIGGGLMIVLGWNARIAAVIVFLFLIPVTLTFHTHWETPDQKMMQLGQLYKNLSIMGGLLLLVAFGPGPLSVDGQAPRITRAERREQTRPHI